MNDNKYLTIKKILIITKDLIINNCCWSLIISWAIYYLLINCSGLSLGIIFLNLILTYVFSTIGLVYYANSFVFKDISENSENKKKLNIFALDEMIICGFIYSIIFVFPQIILNHYSAFIGIFYYKKIIIDDILLGTYLFFCIIIINLISILYYKRKFAKNVVVIFFLISTLFSIGYYEITNVSHSSDNRHGLFQGSYYITDSGDKLLHSHNIVDCAYFTFFCMLIAILIYEIIFRFILSNVNSQNTFIYEKLARKNEIINKNNKFVYCAKGFLIAFVCNLVMYNVVRFYFPASYRCSKNITFCKLITKSQNYDHPEKICKTLEELFSDLDDQYIKKNKIEGKEKEKIIKDRNEKKSYCPSGGIYSLLNNGKDDVTISCSYHSKPDFLNTFYNFVYNLIM